MPVSRATDLVPNLTPPSAARIKDEAGTVIWRFESADGVRLVAKLYRQRGRWSALRCRVTNFRAEREFQRLQHLMRWGVPCTIPFGWAHGWSPEHGYYELLVTEELLDVAELGDHLRASNGAANLQPLFRTVRQMHESGLCHQTLYARNVLIADATTAEPRYYICDVPRSFVFPRSIVGTSMARDDLDDLMASVTRSGGKIEAGDREAYGLGVGISLDGRQSDRRSKRSRFLRDLRTRLYWLAAISAFWKRRATPRSVPAIDTRRFS